MSPPRSPSRRWPCCRDCRLTTCSPLGGSRARCRVRRASGSSCRPTRALAPLEASSTVEIIAGCGVNLDNVAEIVQATGVRQVHAGSAVVCAYSDEAAMGSGVSMGPASAGREAMVSATCPEKVRELCRRCNNGEALEQSGGEAPLGHSRRSRSAFGIEITSDFGQGC
mmetsp:Transcript_12285/g.39332  ORF Transcript_12285/g.39332 Transcript_12285/m.39332 type:complete len:168 (-) Transcript_12285:92-595(-)